LRELIARDFKLRYHRSYLGIGWSLLRPFSQLLVFLFLFGKVLPLGIPHYTTFLLSGVLVWAWFSGSVSGASISVTGNPELVRRPGFPVQILPILIVVGEGIHFLVALPLLLLVAWFDLGTLGVALVALPLVMLVQAMFTLSLSYILAATHVRFRDTQDAANIALTLAFYLTPVFYNPKLVEEHFGAMLWFNPMAHILRAYRAILIDSAFPDFAALGGVLLVSVLVMLFGIWIFERQSAGFAEEL
jgi:lipopolysaccharide transport system permease protein